MASFIVKCPGCGKGNRIPGEKEGIVGRCGQCRTVLSPLYSQPKPLSESNFDGFVAGYSGPVLAEFWAPW